MLRILPMIPVLLAAAATAQEVTAPALATPPERQFDFWIGEWDVRNLHDSSGTWIEGGRATCRVHPVAGGKAVVEHWHGMTRSGETHGFSLRAYDPELERWVLLLNWPPGVDRARFGRLEGSFRHGRGEFFAGRGSKRTRYTFSDITSERLRWDSAATADGGRTWHVDWIMEFTRRPADAPPLTNGRVTGRRLATLPEMRQLDFLDGKWIGRAVGNDEDGKPIDAAATLTCGVILEGLAVTDSLRVEGKGGFERFGVSCWDRTTKRWIRFSVDSRRPVFEMQRGTREGDVATLVFSNDGVVATDSWAADGRGRLTYTRRVVEDGEPSSTLGVELSRAPR